MVLRAWSAFSLAICLVLLCAPPMARAEDFNDVAARFVAGLGAATTTSANPSLDPAAAERFRALLAHFDLAAFSQIALGPHWTAATPAQRQEFITDLAALFERSYAGLFQEYAGGQFDVLGSRLAGPLAALIATRVAAPHSDHVVRIDWYVRGSDGGTPKIVDVIVAGVSTAKTYQDEFGAAIRAGGQGLEGLLAQLRARKIGATVVAAHRD